MEKVTRMAANTCKETVSDVSYNGVPDSAVKSAEALTGPYQVVEMELLRQCKAASYGICTVSAYHRMKIRP